MKPKRPKLQVHSKPETAGKWLVFEKNDAYLGFFAAETGDTHLFHPCGSGMAANPHSAHVSSRTDLSPDSRLLTEDALGEGGPILAQASSPLRTMERTRQVYLVDAGRAQIEKL